MSAYVTAFDGKTLHDGVSRHSKSRLEISVAAQVEVVQMANGTLFDPDYGQGSQVIPQPFSARFFYRFATEAALEAEELALKGKIGDNGTLTAAQTSGAAALTCTATLEKIKLTRRSSDFSFSVELFFKPFIDWS